MPARQAWMYRARSCFFCDNWLGSSLLVIGPACWSSAADRVRGGNGMKIRHSLFVGLVAAFSILLASVAVSAVAAETPFKGTVSAVETGQTVFPIRTITREGTGTATYLGRYTEHVTAQINVLTMSSTGAATFTAANGDTLSASVVGQATRIGPTTLSIVEV